MNVDQNTQAEAQNINLKGKKRDEVTIKRQILTNVKKSLSGLASKREKATGVYVAPTQEEIAAECKKRWQDHVERYLPKEDVSVYFD
ncbi:hypothetical protein P9J64_02985 [Deltaproteobacteria bacterium IMCC39524]|nr:hypothetical protein [Deltaproteobacteria bacterium IMCC39524]